jgi:hypothetical protein
VSAAKLPQASAEDLIAALKERLGPDLVVITGASAFVTQLAEALAIYRRGGEIAHKDGAVAWLEGLAKLHGYILTALEIPPARQWELYEPGQYVHGALAPLGRPVPAELTRQLENSNAQVRQIYRNADAALAMQLQVDQRKSARCAAKIVAKQFNIVGKDARLDPDKVINWREEARRAKGSRKHQALRDRYQLKLRELKECYPDDPFAAYARLIELADVSGNDP